MKYSIFEQKRSKPNSVFMNNNKLNYEDNYFYINNNAHVV